ncbi:MAG: ABC transporter permease [Desulfuromonadales bacterium]|nr:ABC transporter permease [Desulfuromonadales bacterium]
MTPVFMARLAWRNIWRQKRRTLITAGAIALAILLCLFMRSMQEGSYSNNLDNATRFYSGYLQLQHPEFSENNSIDKLLPSDGDFIARIKQIDGVTQAVPRIESMALGAVADKSKGVMVMGVSPQAEDDYSGLAARVKQGRYFDDDDEQAVLVGGQLATYFGLKPGDELTLFGQGYHGNTAAGIFTVVGVVNFPIKQLDSRIVYLPLKTAQQLYVCGEQVTSWVLHGDDVRKIAALERSAGIVMGAQVKVRNWADISPELAQQIALDRVSGQFLVFILYGVVGFGLLATIVMMTLERQREFAVMLATGMPRFKLQGLLMLESLLIALTGMGLGLLITLPILWWFYYHPIPLSGELAMMMVEMGWEPIIPFSLEPKLFVVHMLIILAILALCSLYPLVRIGRMPVMQSLRGGVQ